MTDDLAPIRLETPPELAYLLPRRESFWRWSQENAESIEWLDGRTIAFRGEINAVLTRLAPNGLPPFGAVVMLLAATRTPWDSPSAITASILAEYGRIDAASPRDTLMAAVVTHRVGRDVASIVDDLAAVAALPADLRQGLEARCALAEFVFSVGEPTLKIDAAQRVVELLKDGLDAELLEETSGSDSDFSRLAAELESMRRGLARVAAEPVSVWLRTGLDRAIQPAPGVEPPTADRVRALLRNLQSDPELSGIARLARNVLAAIHIPRSLAAPEEIPVGGVSDISNRGPLDRLLVSELAHDDLTLAVRVALNEALYLRRESPAIHPPFFRAILLDVGIRLWGVPRLFAAAVGLALAASADPRGQAHSFRSQRTGMQEVDLTTRGGLNALLEAIEPDPHPAACLKGMIATMEAATTGAAGVELFIVTHEAVLDDPEFIAQLRAADAKRDWFIATVAHDGSFALWRVGLAGRQAVCRAKLALDDVAPPPTISKGIAAPLLARGSHLPLALFVNPFPLLLAAPIDPRRTVFSDKLGLIAVTQDRRLMRWTRDTAGGLQLHPGLPGGHIDGLFVDERRNTVHVVIVRNKENAIDVLSFDPDTGFCNQREYLRNHPMRVFFREGSLFFGYPDEVRIIGPENWAEQVVKLPAGLAWCRVGRFLRRWSTIYVFTPHGVQKVADHGGAEPFDRDGVPWLLRRDGSVTTADDASVLACHRPFGAAGAITLLSVSPTGDRLTARVMAGEHSGVYLLNLSNNERSAWCRVGSTDADPHAQGGLLGPAISWPSGVNIRHRFNGIFVNKQGLLTLISGTAHARMHGGGDQELRLVNEHATPGRPLARPQDVLTFAPEKGPAESRYTLKAATWPNGSRAYLDSRGLLHLVSSDRKLPQLTLTLSNRPLAGWTSDGRTFGWQYFLPEKPSDDTSLGVALIREFVKRLA